MVLYIVIIYNLFIVGFWVLFVRKYGFFVNEVVGNLECGVERER